MCSRRTLATPGGMPAKCAKAWKRSKASPYVWIVRWLLLAARSDRFHDFASTATSSMAGCVGSDSGSEGLVGLNVSCPFLIRGLAPASLEVRVPESTVHTRSLTL